ncbi:MAG: type II secretion system F family protein [Pirellulales bacterium]|nr:type II secretion system F family protein [Pirellulales bacterium]
MAIFSARAGDKQMASFSRRMATSLSAGLDIHSVVEREAHSHAPRELRQQAQLISDDLRHNGATFGEAVLNTGSYFPPIFRELVQVGDETGHLPETLRRLADNFDTRIHMRRTMIAGCFWPLLQFVIALFVVSLIILIQGFLPSQTGAGIDLLGFGLSGMSGFCIYWAIVCAMAAALYLVARAIMRGLLWTRPLQSLLLKIPVVGTFLESVAMSNLAWAMGLTFNTGLDVRRSIPLSLNATNNALYSEAAPEIADNAASGLSLYDSFRDARVFPGEFLDVLRAGEESGQIPEAMTNFSQRCQETAETLLKRLAIFGGVMVWVLISMLILLVIFRLVMQTFYPYINMINELSQPY